LRRSDLLGALVSGLDGLADDQIKNVHAGCPQDSSKAELV
jgi:hypothetical protein